MSNVQLLTIGSNPNVAFYAWRLYETGYVELSVMNSVLDLSCPISWNSSSLCGESPVSYEPHHKYNSPQEIPASTLFDIVIISAASLQDYQTTCAVLEPLLHNDAIVVVESTGYVKLESVVHLSLPKHKHIPIVSIMNESDVRYVSQNTYWHTSSAPDCRIYFGSSLPADPELAQHINFSRMYRVLQTAQLDSNGAITLLKSLSHREFVTYQWKLALPRIVYQPLSVIFETETPQQLADQILCKPLVSGMIAELFKLIKKMECKLVKGFESEENLLHNQIENFSTTAQKAQNGAPYSNPVFYSYEKQQDLELDLLLLQPILLADDNGVRTPYLENLYSLMCQYMKINQSPSLSIFFERKSNRARLHNSSRDLTQEVEYKRSQAVDLDQDIKQMLEHKKRIEQEVQTQQGKLLELNAHFARREDQLEQVSAELSNQEDQLGQVSSELARAEQRLVMYRQEFESFKKEVSETKKSRQSTYVAKPIERDFDRNEDQAILDASFGHLVIHDIPEQTPGFQQGKMAESGTDDGRDNQSQPNVSGGSSHSQSQTSLSKSGSIASLPYAQQYNVAPAPVHYNQTQGHPQQYQPQPHPPQQQQPPPPPQHQPQQQQQPPPQPHVPPHNGYLAPAAGAPYYHVPQAQAGNSDPSLAAGPAYHAPVHPQYQQGAAPMNYPPQPQQYPAIPPQGYNNGGPPIGHTMSLGGNARYQGQPQYPPQPLQHAGTNGYASRPHRGGSSISVSHADMPGNNQYNQPQQQQQQMYAAPMDHQLEHRFKSNPKKQNRRSALPQLRGPIDGGDMGGRGGMPVMVSQRTSLNGMLNGRNPSPAHGMGDPAYGPAAIAPQHTQSYQQLPTPPPSQHQQTQPQQVMHQGVPRNDSQIPVKPAAVPAQLYPSRNGDSSEVAAKPLGGVTTAAPPQESKKKRGLFGKR